MKMIVGLAMVGLTFPGTVLAQSATFEVKGFPLSLHQAQVVAFPDVREQVMAPVDLENNGIPASPTQVLVLTPRQIAQIDRGPGQLERRWLVPASTPDP